VARAERRALRADRLCAKTFTHDTFRRFGDSHDRLLLHLIHPRANGFHAQSLVAAE